MKKDEFEVEITDCKNKESWYGNKIGQIFIVKFIDESPLLDVIKGKHVTLGYLIGEMNEAGIVGLGIEIKECKRVDGIEILSTAPTVLKNCPKCAGWGRTKIIWSNGQTSDSPCKECEGSGHKGEEDEG